MDDVCRTARQLRRDQSPGAASMHGEPAEMLEVEIGTMEQRDRMREHPSRQPGRPDPKEARVEVIAASEPQTQRILVRLRPHDVATVKVLAHEQGPGHRHRSVVPDPLARHTWAFGEVRNR